MFKMLMDGVNHEHTKSYKEENLSYLPFFCVCVCLVVSRKWTFPLRSNPEAPPLPVTTGVLTMVLPDRCGKPGLVG